MQGGWGGKGGKRGRGGGGSEDEDEGEGGAKKAESVYLILKSGRVKFADYRCVARDAFSDRCRRVIPSWARVGDARSAAPTALPGLPTSRPAPTLCLWPLLNRKDDLWVISSTPDFRSGFAPGQVGDRSRAPWCAVVRSLWHGPNQDGK